jgi:thiamine kinase-like enzyme
MEGASVLADIHSTSVPEGSTLIRSSNPCREILEECDQMFQKYEASELGDPKKKKWIRNMLDACVEKTKEMEDYRGYRCCINTELNSTNFLINQKGHKSYLIDWEKPLYGDPAQDLGHFLAPTTTFWKTDVILSPEQMDEFLDEYIRQVDGRFDTDHLKERVGIFVPVTCLRGVTWCAMAWVEYQQPGRAIRNESTWNKLGQYLEHSFLEMIEKQVEMIDI